MALTIVNEQYPPRKPKLTLTADSLDELPTEGVAEGSTATVGGTEYSYDSNAGWIVPGSGGGGGSVYVIETVYDNELMAYKTVKTAAQLYEEVNAVSVNGAPVMIASVGWGTPYDVLVETYRSEDAPPGADPEGYTITMTSLEIPDDSDSTSLSLIQYWERVPMSDANDHPFVFSHHSNHYEWSINITPETN